MALFIEEIVKSYKDGKIHSSFSPERVKNLIFTSLQNSNRFNGITKIPYSTLTHSYVVGKLASDFGMIYFDYDNKKRDWAKLFGYMHDMGEMIVGDIVYPLKTGVFQETANEFQKLENAVLNWIGSEIFDIPDFERKWELFYPCVKKADGYMGVLEMIGLSKDSDNFESDCILEYLRIFSPIYKAIEADEFRTEFENLLDKCIKSEEVKK